VGADGGDGGGGEARERGEISGEDGEGGEKMQAARLKVFVGKRRMAAVESSLGCGFPGSEAV
jgi:hypothetical protein